MPVLPLFPGEDPFGPDGQILGGKKKWIEITEALRSFYELNMHNPHTILFRSSRMILKNQEHLLLILNKSVAQKQWQARSFKSSP